MEASASGDAAEVRGVVYPGEWSVVERAVRAAAEALIAAEQVCGIALFVTVWSGYY